MAATKSRKGDGAYVALLRAVNVGGKRSLPMKSLVEMFVGAGCVDVRSYVQSGNVVFRAKEALAERVPALVAAAIETRFGFEAPIIVRTAGELHDIARRNPFLEAGAAPDCLHVAFLEGRPAPAKLASLDPKRSHPDAFSARGREIYLFCPNGFGRTKLTNAWFDAQLGTTSTVRNWRTVSNLLELALAPR